MNESIKTKVIIITMIKVSSSNQTTVATGPGGGKCSGRGEEEEEGASLGQNSSEDNFRDNCWNTENASPLARPHC